MDLAVESLQTLASYMNISKAEHLLQPVLEFVKEYEGEDYYTGIVQELENEAINSFLTSNSLWGGAGSVADQAGIDGGREARRKIEGLLIPLGEFQISLGVVNPRTKSWVEVFKEWEKNNI